MSGASWKHFYEEQSAANLAFDRPVDTFAASTAMDSVSHLVDVSPVYRVNWVDPHGIYTLYTTPDGIGDQYLLVSHDFPTTIVKPWEYPNYDVKVAAAVTSGVSLYVYVHISSTQGPYLTFWDLPALVGHFSATTTSSTPSWVIDGQIRSAGRNTKITPAAVTLTDMSTDHVGEATSAYVTMARVSVYIAATFESADDYGKLYGIQVREFVND